jgi:hypothetical protein
MTKKFSLSHSSKAALCWRLAFFSSVGQSGGSNILNLPSPTLSSRPPIATMAKSTSTGVFMRTPRRAVVRRATTAILHPLRRQRRRWGRLAEFPFVDPLMR